jgi:hypothetical protein
MEIVVNVRILVRGPEGRQVEHIASVQEEGDLHQGIGVALEMYRQFYPDAPLEKTVSIDRG